jgi:uncharacterized protein
MDTPRSLPVTTFRTPAHSYLYDAATHHIVRVGEPVARIAEAFYAGELEGPRPWERWGLAASEYERAVAFLTALQRETGVFVPQRPGRVTAAGAAEAVVSGSARRQPGRALNALVLNVTDACNLRCSYCIYSGRYPGRRRHAPRRMRWETAKRSIDYLAEHGGGADQPLRSLGWYGGEPLLAFPLIEKSAAYFRQVFEGYETRFHLTTNATLWTEAMLDFFAAYEVGLLVSLDGPAERHDAHRKRPDGGGTHARVLANLERLHRRHPGYFERRVSLNAVVTPPVDFVALDRFFSRFPLRVGISTADPAGLDEAGLEMAESRGWAEMREKFLRGCLESRLGGPEAKRRGYGFVSPLFLRDLERLHRRSIQPGFPEELPAHGCCIPGKEQLFVTTDGGFETCEKTEGAGVLHLGDVETGVDPEAADRVFRRFSELSWEACRSCFNVRLCTVCFAHALFDGRFDERKLRWNCDLLRQRTRQMLSLYCEILEHDRDALDFLDLLDERPAAS